MTKKPTDERCAVALERIASRYEAHTKSLEKLSAGAFALYAELLSRTGFGELLPGLAPPASRRARGR